MDKSISKKLDNIDSASRINDLHIIKKIDGPFIGIKSSINSSSIQFESIAELNDYLEDNSMIRDNDYYIIVNGLKVTKEELESFDKNKMILVTSDNLSDEDSELFSLGNVILGTSEVPSKVFIESFNRQRRTVKKIIISHLDREVIESLIDKSNDKIEIVVEISDLEELRLVSELVRKVLFKDRVVINISKGFFSDEENRKALSDKNLQREFSKIPKKYEVNYSSDKAYDISEIFEAKRIIENILSRVPSTASSLDKVTFVSEYLLHYINYSRSIVFNDHVNQMFKLHPDDYSIVQILRSGNGVCRHISKIAKYMLDELGVECNECGIPVFYGDGHKFNSVMIDGELSYLDITYMIGELEQRKIKNCTQSEYFLTDRTRFGHSKFLMDIDDVGVSIDDKEKNDSLDSVREYDRKTITYEDLKELFISRKVRRNISKTLKKVGSK